MPKAAVTVTEVNTGVARTASTTEYRVEITGSGFQKWVRDNVEVTVASSARVNASLELGALAETVEVKAESPLLQTDRAEVARTFGTQPLHELPFAERSPQAIVGLVAGVDPPSTNAHDLEGPRHHHIPRQRPAGQRQ